LKELLFDENRRVKWMFSAMIPINYTAMKGSNDMSNQEIAKNMIDQLPEYVPNADTLEAFAELGSGGGHTFKGSTSDFFAGLLEG
jgi:hypothetical protein